MKTPLKITIGVPAWNEETGIVPALESILGQTLIQNAAGLGIEAELIVIANGCTDRTVELTRVFFSRVRETFPDGGPVDLKLEELAESGFANVWNLLSHSFSRRDADFIFFVNADIVITRSDLFEQMLNTLRENPELQVVSPKGRKHIEAARCKSLFDRLNLAVTRFSDADQAGQVRGHCFCARAPAMRSVWLPKSFPGAVDGLFKRLIVTDAIRRPDDLSRIGAVDAGYTFEAYRTFRDIAARRVRLFVGQTFIETLIRHLKAMREKHPEMDVSAYLRGRDETDPSWLHRLVQFSIKQNGLRFTMPSPWFRFRYLRRPDLGMFRKTGMLPVALIAFAFDLPVFIAAAIRLKTGRISDVWKDTHNQEKELTSS
jgi:glycosyltransferase involved in cell wall biosynthesis